MKMFSDHPAISGLHRRTHHKDPVARGGRERRPAGSMEPQRGTERRGSTRGAR